jgi:hypothetical protein
MKAKMNEKEEHEEMERLLKEWHRIGADEKISFVEWPEGQNESR